MADSTIREIHEFDEQLLHQLNQESNRGITLIAAAILDDSLEALLSASVIALSKEEEHRKIIRLKLFGDIGPLQTFSSKVELAYAVGAIDKTLWEALHIVRKLRNDFAHSVDIRYDDDSVKARIYNLSEKLYPKTELKPDGKLLNKLGYMLYGMAEEAKQKGTRDLFDHCITTMQSSLVLQIKALKFSPDSWSPTVYEKLCRHL